MVMEILTDPFLGRAAIALILGVLATLWFFGADVFLLVTRRRFGFVNINVAIFTKRDYKSTSNKLLYRTIDGTVPLQKILRNRFLFWYVIWSSLKASLPEPVLQLESYTYRILSLVRSHITARFAGMELKRFAGMPFVLTPCKLCIVYDRSEDRKDERTRILRVMIIPTEILENFDDYLRRPPGNSLNWELMLQIYEAYINDEGSFIDIDIPTA